jgi:hypothetical protein
MRSFPIESDIQHKIMPRNHCQLVVAQLLYEEWISPRMSRSSAIPLKRASDYLERPFAYFLRPVLFP